ncbi:MAG TPA: GNAT family N-acetyltransferase [Ignavibacteria bacterium]|jgi:hypothetical protein
MSSGDYKFERLDENRLVDLQYLYKDAFLTDVSLEFLKKKYDTSAYGVRYAGYVAYDKTDSPAAYYGVFPLHVENKNQVILAAQSGDTMTHSAHRGKGLFYNLATQTYKLAEQIGIKFVYGFPNTNSFHGFMKLKWTHDGNIKKYRIKVPALPASVFSGKSTAYQKYVNTVLSNHISKKKYFENSLPHDEYIAVKHDEAYFRYKEYSKKYILDIAGKCVYVKAEKSLQIGDIERCSENEFFSILNKLKKIAFKIGIPIITFQVSPGIEYDRFLEKKYNAEESVAIGYINFSNLELNKLRFTFADFDTF